jgi:hypothetical protein
MTTTTEIVAAARKRYANAVIELRAAFGDLIALDRLYRLATFGGSQPDVIALRHPVAAPDVTGTFEDDVRAAHAVRSASMRTARTI